MEPTRKTLSLTLLDNFVREKLESISRELETSLRMDGLSHAIHFVLMELVGNAVKANLKRVFFKRNGFDLDDPESYARGVRAFMKDYNALDEAQYQSALEELEFNVNVHVDLNEDRLLIHVDNRALLLAEEERRIRRQLAGSMNVKNIVEFSLEYGDDTEGRGLGLAMIVLLIRDLGFNPDLFRVYQDGLRTIARLEFPLSADYTPVRDAFLRSNGSANH